MTDKIKLLCLFMLSILLAILFIGYNIDMNQFQYIFHFRITKIIAIILIGFSISFSSVLFQTITNNRLLTPSIIGFDALYLMIQSFIVLFLKEINPILLDSRIVFIYSCFIMILFSNILYKLLFKSSINNIYYILLAGVVCGVLFRSITSFIEKIIDSDKYQLLQIKMFANFDLIDTRLLLLSSIVIIFTVLYYIYTSRVSNNELDIYLIGRENAFTLGIDTDNLQKTTLFIISILVSVSTALIGPITFLGIFVTNISYILFSTYKHSIIILGSTLLSYIILLGGLFLVERVIPFETNISVIINGIGGIFFIYLLIKEGKKCYL